MDAGHVLPDDAAEVSNTHVYEKDVQPAGASIDMDAGHALPGDTAAISNTHVYKKDVQPAGSYIDMDAGHVLPSDTADVSNVHVYEKDVQPAGASIDMDAGHALPSDTAEVSNIHVYEKDVQPEGTSSDMDAGHMLPSDTAPVSNTHVYKKVVTSEPNEVNWQNRTVTITPVDAKGQPIKGLAPLKVTGTAGYPVQVPTLPGYTAQLTTIVATNGANKVIYTPNQVTGTVVLPSNLGGQTVAGITGVTGAIIQVAVPQITGYTADRNTIPVRIEANGAFTPLAQVHYVAQSGDKGAATPEAVTAATQQPKSTMRLATVQQASTKARTNAPITKQTNAATAKELPQTGSTTAEPATLAGMAMLSLTAGLLGLFGKKRKKEDQ
jgi:LPXTG-motif cell wall-anchored protein